MYTQIYKKTKNLKVVYDSKTSPIREGFSDADWASDFMFQIMKIDRKIKPHDMVLMKK